jgi:chromosomal replication initiation ATPase DnaA
MKPEFTINPETSVLEAEVPSTCQACGGSFMALATSMGGRAIASQSYCDPCLVQMRKDAQAARDARPEPHIRAWGAITPAEYRDHNPERLPSDAADSRRRAYRWSEEGVPRWLVLIGPKGLGKTRIAFQVLKRVGAKGGAMRYVRASQLDKWSSSQFQDGSTGAQEIARCHTARWLFIDDLGKGKLTERAEAELYDLIEHRHANRMPLILTSNLELDKLPWCSVDRGSAIVGRILDNSTVN